MYTYYIYIYIYIYMYILLQGSSPEVKGLAWIPQYNGLTQEVSTAEHRSAKQS